MIQKERISNVALVVLLVLVGALAIIRVLVANHAVSVSSKLRTLDDQISSLESENEVLSENLRQEQSLLVLEQRAQDLGFVPLNTYSYAAKTLPVAFNLNEANP